MVPEGGQKFNRTTILALLPTARGVAAADIQREARLAFYCSPYFVVNAVFPRQNPREGAMKHKPLIFNRPHR